eukprot:IDg7129t1
MITFRNAAVIIAALSVLAFATASPPVSKVTETGTSIGAVSLRASARLYCFTKSQNAATGSARAGSIASRLSALSNISVSISRTIAASSINGFVSARPNAIPASAPIYTARRFVLLAASVSKSPSRDSRKHL